MPPPPLRFPGIPGLPTARPAVPVAAPPPVMPGPSTRVPMAALGVGPSLDASGPMLSLPQPAALAPADQLAGTTLGADLAGPALVEAPVDPLMAELGAAPRAPSTAIPFFAAASGGPRIAPRQAQAPASAPGPSSAVPFLASLETGQPAAAYMPAARRGAGPVRLVGGSRRAPVEAPAVDSLGRPLDPDAVDQIASGPAWAGPPQEGALDRELRALDVARQLEQQRAEMMARQGADQADAEEGYRRQQEGLEAERRDAEGRARASYDNAIRRVESMHVDPSRWYRQQGAVGTLASALAVGLGAFGEALGGGPNIAIQQVNRAIDADLQAQDRDISTAQAGAEQRRGLLHEVRSDFSSRQAALDATRAIMLREMAARFEAQAAAQGSAEALANGRVARDRLLSEAEAAAQRAQLEELNTTLNLRLLAARVRTREAEASRAERRGMGGGVAAPRPVTSAQVSAARDLMASGIDSSQASQLAGLPVELPQAPITTEQRSALDALDSSIRVIEDAIQLGEQTGDIAGVGILDRNLPSFLQSDEGQRVRTAIRMLIDSMGRLRSGGAISDDEFTSFTSMVEGAGTERDLRIGVGLIRRELAARMGYGGRRQSAAGAADEAVSAAGLRQVE